MKLLDRNGYRADDFSRADLAGAERLDNVIVPYADLAAAPARKEGRKLGVEIPNSVKADDLVPHFGKLHLIAIAFPGSGDGRGFSIAKQLRRLGFKGVLRAVGPLIADQFPYALACGFDEVELPEASADRQPQGQWAHALAAITSGYQRGYARPASIFEQRKLAREGGRNA